MEAVELPKVSLVLACMVLFEKHKSYCYHSVVVFVVVVVVGVVGVVCVPNQVKVCVIVTL